MIGKIFAVIIIFALLLLILKKHIWWLIGFVILLFVIRLIADAYWAYKDTKQW